MLLWRVKKNSTQKSFKFYPFTIFYHIISYIFLLRTLHNMHLVNKSWFCHKKRSFMQFLILMTDTYIQNRSFNSRIFERINGFRELSLTKCFCNWFGKYQVYTRVIRISRPWSNITYSSLSTSRWLSVGKKMSWKCVEFSYKLRASSSLL